VHFAVAGKSSTEQHSDTLAHAPFKGTQQRFFAGVEGLMTE